MQVPTPGTERRTLTGIGVSAGTAVGPVAVMAPPVGVDEQEPACTDPEADGQRVRAALAEVAESLRARAAALAEGPQRDVLAACAALATDKALLKSVDGQLRGGAGVTRAVHDAVEVYAAKLRALGGTMAERVTDLYDIRDRAVARLRGLPEPGVPALERPSILVAADLVPADTVALDPASVLGIVTEAGGVTSHTAILAAQLGIPAVVQAKGILAVPPGSFVAIDATSGDVIIAPTNADTAELAVRAAPAEYGPGHAHGHEVKLLANIGTAADAAAASALDVEGCGLLRTEFLFLDRESAPTVEEQAEAYAGVLRAFGRRRVVARTLDAGADKPLRFASLGPEANPALGRRGLRLSMAREELLDAQLLALAKARAAAPGCDLRVMAPMVATQEEAEWFVGRARSFGLDRVGVMVETPAAALTAERILGVADFASIGTNDLSQYTMAADRTQGDLAPLLSVWQPAVLAMIRAAVEGGRAAGKPVGVCGEAGGDPLAALVLVGLGVASLSMAPVKLGPVRVALRGHDLETCREMARRALAAPTATQARDAVRDLL
ncbi:phosphoenolpyruvate--protein phosphotransferase [Corynebacterium bouchesdurhonense]|uniref:phosphoenolpyruvate--protein phosphotransferase n=1 Tax=Corynebacterium bouchesdurhonense TaxID=1720192 RepID=UPI0008321EAB|nr:phosphoenolpyruvate--protein phosphotransferase [Corynebacterium bouchesdurhonense]